MSDEELLDLAQQRDEEAFAELMRRNSSSSMKLALSILKDRQEAEDEVQNSYWNAWRSVERFRRGSTFSTWISRIVVNQCLMRLRKARRASFLFLDEGVEGSVAQLELPDRRSTPEDELGEREVHDLLHAEINRLPPLMRNVVLLRDIDELSMAEVAGRLGITVVAAKSRLLRARKELRRRLESLDGRFNETAVPA